MELFIFYNFEAKRIKKAFDLKSRDLFLYKKRAYFEVTQFLV